MEILEQGKEEIPNIDDNFKAKAATLQHKNQWQMVCTMYYIEPSHRDPNFDSLLETLVHCGDPLYANATR